MGTVYASWPRILDSNIRSRAVEMVGSMCDALMGMELPEDGSLIQGHAGVSLFLAYASRLPEFRSAWSPETPFHHCVEVGARTKFELFLFGGWLGIGWVGAHLPRLCIETEEFLESIDLSIEKHLAEPPEPLEWDLFNGLVGIGVYLLERLPEPWAAEALSRLGVCLWNTARRLETGISWYRPADLIAADSRSAFPRGHFDLGVSHGVAGVISFLSSMVAAGHFSEDARELVDASIPWLLSWRKADSARSFPSFVVWTESGWTGRSARAGRLYGDPGWECWSYGDLSRGLALLNGGRWTGNRAWTEAGLRVVLDAWRNADEWLDRNPPGFIDGTAGLAHMFGRVHQVTGRSVFLDASRFLFEHTLDRLEQSKRDGWTNWSCGLAGLSGVGLAFVSACDPIEPEWDRLFLMSSRSKIGTLV